MRNTYTSRAHSASQLRGSESIGPGAPRVLVLLVPRWPIEHSVALRSACMCVRVCYETVAAFSKKTANRSIGSSSVQVRRGKRSIDRSVSRGWLQREHSRGVALRETTRRERKRGAGEDGSRARYPAVGRTDPAVWRQSSD